jgi:hypothetical protein
VRSKRNKATVLAAVEMLKGLDCDSARAKVTDLDHRAERLHQQLSTARQLESLRASSLQTLLKAMPTFDPVVFRSGVASVHAAQKESRNIEEKSNALNSELDVAREQLLQVTAGHEVIKKEHRKSVGKLMRSQLQVTEYATEDMFTSRQRSSHGSFKFSV